MFQEQLLSHFQGDHRLDEMARYHLATGGKFLRGRLALIEAQAISLPEKEALTWAMSCELLHNATLIHDDIQDNDTIRRGQESVWKKYGVAQAINVGDLLIFKSFRLTSMLNSPRLSQALAETAEVLVHGQCSELESLTCDPSHLWEAYLKMVEQKTGALFRLPILGVHLLKNPDCLVTDLDHWLDLGVCYQILDDIRDYRGEKSFQKKQKDFIEKRMNALISFLARDSSHHDLINQYASVALDSAEQRQVIEKLCLRVQQTNTIEKLQIFASERLQAFKAQSHASTQKLIIDFINQAFPGDRPFVQFQL